MSKVWGAYSAHFGHVSRTCRTYIGHVSRTCHIIVSLFPRVSALAGLRGRARLGRPSRPRSRLSLPRVCLSLSGLLSGTPLAMPAAARSHPKWSPFGGPCVGRLLSARFLASLAVPSLLPASRLLRPAGAPPRLRACALPASATLWPGVRSRAFRFMPVGARLSPCVPPRPLAALGPAGRPLPGSSLRAAGALAPPESPRLRLASLAELHLSL